MDDCEVFIRALNHIPGLSLVYQYVTLFVNSQSSSSDYDTSGGHFACKLSELLFLFRIPCGLFCYLSGIHDALHLICEILLNSK